MNSLTGYLKALGHKVPKAAVTAYLAWFEDAYFLFSVPIFDASLARRNTNPKKIYCIDHALVTSVSAGILVNAGHLLENPGIHRAATPLPANFLLQDRDQAGSRLRRSSAGARTAAGPGVVKLWSIRTCDSARSRRWGLP